MFINPLHPLCNYPFQNDVYTSVGKFTNFEKVQEEDQIYFNWEVELLPGFTTSDYNIYIFVDGLYYDKTNSDNWVYSFPYSKSKVRLDFFILPPWDYKDFPFINNFIPNETLTLNWTLDGATKFVEIYQEEIGTNFDYNKPVKTFSNPLPVSTVNISGSNYCLVDGVWKGTERYTTIDIEITNNGIAPYPKFKYTYNSVVYTNNSITGKRQEFFNGLKITFDDETDYAIGNKWTVTISLPTEYTTNELEDGDYWFQVRTSNCGYSFAYSDYGYGYINLPPDQPEYIDHIFYPPPDYGYSFPYAYVTWQAPSNTDIDHYLIYKNTYGYEGLEMIPHWFPYEKGSILPDDYFSVVCSPLFAGTNRILAHSVDTEGHEEMNMDYLEIVVNDSNQEVVVPNKPFSISCECLVGYLQLTIHCDNTCDTINIYHDSETGTVDYNTVFESISNTGTKTINVIKHNISLTDGSYIIAARAEKNNVEETNTDVQCKIDVLTSTPPTPSGLTVT